MAALEIASAHPDRVRSLTMLSAPGAQEFELLGNPLVNKIVYGFHGAFFWGVARLTPNFGAADLLPWDRDYAATIFETDLSESKQVIFGWRKPMLIIHGEDDWLTPVQAATYSAQLAPQAKLVLLPGGRNVVFKEQGRVVSEIIGFVDAPPAVAVTEAREYPPLPSAVGAHFWILLVIIVICTFVAEDPTCLATGLMVSVGIIDFWSGRPPAPSVSSLAISCSIQSGGSMGGRRLPRPRLSGSLKKVRSTNGPGGFPRRRACWSSSVRALFRPVAYRPLSPRGS